MKVFSFFAGRKTQVSLRKTKKIYVIVLCGLCFLLVDIQLGSIFDPADGVVGSLLHKNSLSVGRSSRDARFLHKRTYSESENDKPNTNRGENISQSDSLHLLRFSSPLTLIIVVCSHPEHVQLRQTIRATWGSDVRVLFRVEIVFLLGLSGDESWQELTRREMVLHGDIVRVNVPEDYRNLARKVTKGMNWVVENAPRASYYMKCDDDVYINLPYLLKELSRGVISSNNILGALSPSAHVIRDPRDEWSVPFDVFPAKTFPPYVAGGAYVMSMSALKLLLSVLPSRTDIHLEDVFITGILAQNAGVSHVGHSGFSFWSSAKAKPCDIISNRKIVSVNMSVKRILKLHSQISELMSRRMMSCSNISSI